LVFRELEEEGEEMDGLRKIDPRNHASRTTRIHTRASALLLAVTFVIGLAAGASAQQGTTEARGSVRDPDHAALPGVAIVLRNQDTGLFRETTSGTDGTYFASGITPGVYEVTAELSGFQKYVHRDIRLEIGKTATVDIDLVLGNLTETVTINAEPPLVDVTSKEVGGNISSRELVSLPSVNRNFIGLIGVLPGIVPTISTESFGGDNISANGQDPRNTNYMLDGGNNNDDVIGQRAGTQARTTIESIQEFQVITSQFDAEYGRTIGAVVNAVTKQGTNTFHGSAFGFFQDASLTGREFFAKQNNLAKPDTNQQQWGGTIGGPIVRDKAHFFFSLERVAINRGITVNVPAQPSLNGTTTTQDRVWNTVIRGDHQINNNNTWSVRWLREQSPQVNQIINNGTNVTTLSAPREESDIDQTLVGTLTSVMGAHRVNTFRTGWTQENVAFGNPGFNQNGRHQDELEPTLQFQTYTTQQNSTAQARVDNAFQLEDTFAWFVPGKHGSHEIKFGVQYEYVGARSQAQDNWNGTFVFAQSNAPFNAADPRTYPDSFSIRVPGASISYVKAQYLGAFAQDKWQISSRLTASLGVRYDLESIPTPGIDDDSLGLHGTYPVDKNNFGPRLGLTYALDKAGRSVVRGGYGLFFDKTAQEVGLTNLFTGGIFSDSFIVTFPAANQADQGPRNGQFPTNEFLVNGPTVNQALLDARYPPGSKIKNTGGVNVNNPDRIVQNSQEYSIGYERQVGGSASVSADYVRIAGRDLLMTINLNPGLRDTTVSTSTLRRINPNFTAGVSELVNTGDTDYDALQLALDKRFTHGFSTRVSYTLANGRGNTAANGASGSSFQLLTDLRLDRNQGPTDFDRRHNFVISGSAIVPKTKGLTVSWLARALSGLPFTIINSTIDAERNGLQAVNPIAAGSYSGTGANAVTLTNDGGRNGARGPGFFELDTRVGYRVAPRPGMTIDLFAEIFNLTNRVNYAIPNGDASNAAFLRYTASLAGAVPRTGQLGVRLGF
jgi:hypothetical protein